jgi:hypothetical protein
MYPDCVIAATTDIIDGVVVAVLADTEASLPYRAASTLRRLLVCTDPNMLYEVQEGNSGTPFTLNDVGLNVSLSVTPAARPRASPAPCSTTRPKRPPTPWSPRSWRRSTVRTSAIGLANRWLVRINRHRLVDQFIGV